MLLWTLAVFIAKFKYSIKWDSKHKISYFFKDLFEIFAYIY